MPVNLSEATRDFDITMLENISPLIWTHLAYNTATYAFCHAVVKTCNKKKRISPDGIKHLGTLIYGNLFKS